MSLASALIHIHILCADFKTHQLPLARIKKIMKSDEDVKVFSPISLYLLLFCNHEHVSFILIVVLIDVDAHILLCPLAMLNMCINNQ